MLIKFFIVLFAIFALSRVAYRYKKEEITLREAIIWFLFWFCAIGVAIIPESTNFIARFFGVGRGADFIVYVSLIILFYSVFRLLGRLYKIERDITKIVQYMALDAKKKNE